MILAGDIGGTKTHLALYDWTADRIDPLRLETFHSADYGSLEELLADFLSPPKPPVAVDPAQELHELGTLRWRPLPEHLEQSRATLLVDAAAVLPADDVLHDVPPVA